MSRAAPGDGLNIWKKAKDGITKWQEWGYNAQNMAVK